MTAFPSRNRSDDQHIESSPRLWQIFDVEVGESHPAYFLIKIITKLDHEVEYFDFSQYWFILLKGWKHENRPQNVKINVVLLAFYGDLERGIIQVDLSSVPELVDVEDRN